MKTNGQTEKTEKSEISMRLGQININSRRLLANGYERLSRGAFAIVSNGGGI